MLVGYTICPRYVLARLVGTLRFQENSTATMARLMGKFGIVDRAAAMNASTEAFYDNRFVDEVKAVRIFERALEVVGWKQRA
jgi:hypothetical protein